MQFKKVKYNILKINTMKLRLIEAFSNNVTYANTKHKLIQPALLNTT